MRQPFLSLNSISYLTLFILSKAILLSTLLFLPLWANSPNYSEGAEAEEEQTSDDFVQGIYKYYFQTGIEAGFEDTNKCEPSVPKCKVEVPESRHLLNFDALIGWGPLVSEWIYFTPYYRYSHNWATDYFQEELFFKRWFSTFKTEDFIVPTRQMLRNHEFAFDLRGLYGGKNDEWYFQAGLFTKLIWSRLGSKLWGENFEESETIYKTENFVPYVIFKQPKKYRITFYIPFKTELNKDDPRLSLKTYNLTIKGRGFSVSPHLIGEGLIPKINWIGFSELSLTEFKVASIQNDKRRIKFSIGARIPLPFGLKIIPQVGILHDTFLVPRIRIDNFSKDENADVNEPASQPKRKDTTLDIATSVVYNHKKRHKFYFDFQYLKLTSSLVEFDASKLEIIVGYKYSLPTSSFVQRRFELFSERDNGEDL
jgi:hypothetical protein